jgi:predicted DNA-binding transcriptional regulator YafY
MKIDQEGKVKAHDMAEALEGSCRTIYRDIDVLCEAGYPILTTTGQNGGITFMEGYQLNLDQADDTFQTLVAHLYAMPEQEKLIKALESGMKLKYLSGDGLRNEGKHKILIDKKSWWEEDTTDINLQPIMKALFLQQKLRIQYTLSDGTKSERIIAPYGLVLKYTSWYLIAFCYIRHEIRTFRCTRMEEITLFQETYIIPEDFDLKSYWSLSTKAFRQNRRENEYYPVEVKLHEAYGAVLKDYDVIGIKKEEATVIAMIDMHRKDVAEEDIRALLCYGQILYPEEMRVKAKEILARSIQEYHD